MGIIVVAAYKWWLFADYSPSPNLGRSEFQIQVDSHTVSHTVMVADTGISETLGLDLFMQYCQNLDLKNGKLSWDNGLDNPTGSTRGGAGSEIFC